MRPYGAADYESISQWCSLRDQAPPLEKYMPDTGLIIDDIACGFLIVTSNGCGILDFYITNPHADRDDRKRALFEITEELLEVARDSNLNMILADTKSGSIERLALKMGFKELGEFKSFALEL